MELRNFNVYFFFILLAAITFSAYLVVRPFISAILFAAFLAIVFRRPYLFFLRLTRRREILSSLLASIFVILAVSVPFSLIIVMLTQETRDIIQIINHSPQINGFFEKYFSSALDFIKNTAQIPTIQPEFLTQQQNFFDLAKNISQETLLILQKIYQNVADFFFMTFVTFFTLFFFFIEGEALVKKILRLSPLKNQQERMLLRKFASITRATLKGALIIGAIQGALGGIVFFIAGVHSPFIWAVLMGIMSLAPMIGTGLVWFPIGVIMLTLGNVWQGLFILAAGFGIISTVDNFLRPKLVGEDSQMHPLLVFFSTLGGIALFGFSGFIIGPIIIALFISVWEIYALEFKEQLKIYNNS